MGGDGVGSSDRNRLMQQLANGRDVVLAVGVGEQAVAQLPLIRGIGQREI
jgi:hypothetical protein